VIIVTHDNRIYQFADTMAEMEDGQIGSLERRVGSTLQMAATHE
jgi:ABC-type lipoprotein export system ATPase subunit